jgi:hypothetical protein
MKQSDRQQSEEAFAKYQRSVWRVPELPKATEGFHPDRKPSRPATTLAELMYPHLRRSGDE